MGEAHERQPENKDNPETMSSKLRGWIVAQSNAKAEDHLDTLNESRLKSRTHLFPTRGHLVVEPRGKQELIINFHEEFYMERVNEGMNACVQRQDASRKLACAIRYYNLSMSDLL